MATKGKILIITVDQALVKDLLPSLAARDFEGVLAPNAREAVMKIGSEGPFAGVIADQNQMPEPERAGLLQIHKESGLFPLVMLESSASLSPAETRPLRRLFWPLPPGFADQVRAANRPTVFFADKTLYMTGSLADALKASGVAPVVMESPKGMASFLQQQMDAPEPTPQAKSKGFLGKIMGGEDPVEVRPRLGHVMIALFSGMAAEAEALDAGIRKYVPNTICYFVLSDDPAVAAAKAIAAGQPAVLAYDREKDGAGRLAGLFDKDAVRLAAAPAGKERILVMENDPHALKTWCATLMAAGYEIVTLTPEEALKSGATQKFSIAVLGTALTNAKITGPQLAAELRKTDPNIHFILTVDPGGPFMTTMRAIGKAADSGIDAVVAKDLPLDTEHLLSAVKKSLRARFNELEIVRLSKENEEKRKQVEQINGFQTKFFATVAHDVKNPLAAIMGYAEILTMKLKDRAPELSNAMHIHNAAKTLNILISDLVDAAAIESGKLRVQMGPLDLISVVADVKSRIDVVAGQRKINFIVELPAQLPPLIGDPQRLGQVIQNLCTNAIQYTREGGKVTLRVDAAADRVVVGVRDTGIGISKADLPRVFERFFQTEEAQKMRKAGFGLGLKISREIVQMHGGEIGVESEFGVGSHFFFHIPIQKQK